MVFGCLIMIQVYINTIQQLVNNRLSTDKLRVFELFHQA